MGQVLWPSMPIQTLEQKPPKNRYLCMTPTQAKPAVEQKPVVGQPLTVTELLDLLSASKAVLQAQCALIDAAMKRLRVMEEALVEIATHRDEPWSQEEARTALKL